MSFEQPAWLALLLALPLLWLLTRRMRGPRVLRVSSVQPFRAAADEPAAARPRRRVDVALVLLLAAAGALALSAAGPVLGGRGAAVYVVVDTSPSMHARLVGGGTVITDAIVRAEQLLGDAEAIVRPLHDPGAEAETRGDLARLAVDPPLSPGADGLPGSLASHLDVARSLGFPGVLLVTDRARSLPGVVVVGPSAAAGANFGIAGVVLDRDGDGVIVSVRSTADESTDVAVRGRSQQVVASVPARGVASVRVPDAEPDGFTLAVADALPLDDRVAVERTGGARTAGLTGEAPFDRIRRALAACGLRVIDVAEGVDVLVRRGGPARIAAGRPMLQFAAEPGPVRAGIRVARTGPAVVRGAAMSGRGELAAGLPSPAASVAATGRVEGGSAALMDASGPLVTVAEGAVLACIDPEDPASTWHEEPSFAVFVAAALEHLVGKDRIEISGGVPLSEMDLAPAAVPRPAPAALRALERRDRGRSLAPGLAVLAACCVLGAVLAGRRLGR